MKLEEYKTLSAKEENFEMISDTARILFQMIKFWGYPEDLIDLNLTDTNILAVLSPIYSNITNK